MGHALLLAKLPAAQQEEALAACFRKLHRRQQSRSASCSPFAICNSGSSTTSCWILKPRRSRKRTRSLCPRRVPALDCPKRTGHNILLFADLRRRTTCSDPACYAAKVDAHVKQTVAAKPKLVQISTAYGKPPKAAPVVPRNKYVEIRQEKPKNERAGETRRSSRRASTPPRPSSPRAARRANCARSAPIPIARCITPRSSGDGRTPMPHSRPQQEKQPPRGSHCPGHRPPRLESHRRRRSRPADEARPAVCGETADRGTGRTASGDRHPAARHRQAEGRRGPGEAACGLSAEGRGKHNSVRILVETAILLSMHNQADTAKVLRDAARPTRWTRTPSPRRSNRSSPRRRKRKPQRRPRPNRQPRTRSKPAKKSAAA